MQGEVLIIGAGILGSATAWHLAQLQVSGITVIDLDLAGTYSSSELNAGGARATWWQDINMELARDSLNFYRKIAADIQFFPKGYLFLYSRSKWKIALSKRSRYENLGIHVEYLDPTDLKSHLPEFTNLKGISGGTYSPQDGLLDPHLLKEYYRRGAKAKGVRFLDRHYFTGAQIERKRITAIHTQVWRAPTFPENILHTLLTEHRLTGEHWEKQTYHPKWVINCTGAWLGKTGQFLETKIPVHPLRRQISLFSSHEEDFRSRGMIVDSSGLYFHAEGGSQGLVLAGYSNKDEAPGFRFQYDGVPFFDRKIWLRLYRRGGGQFFTALKHLRGWAGLYAISPDRTALLGQVPGLTNLYVLGAATGRGVMQSYALGRALAEWVTTGRFSTLDASPLSPFRHQEKRYLQENLDI